MSNYEKIKNILPRLFRALFVHEQWNVGIVRNPIHSFLDKNFRPKIEWLANPKNNEFLADPFGIEKNGKNHVFYEHFNYHSFIGKINSAEIKDGRLINISKEAIRLPVHASYPYLFQEENEIYCVLETFSQNQIDLYKAEEFPHHWKKAATLVENFAGVDPTIIKFQDRWWLFATDEYDGKYEKLHIFHADDLLGPWMPHSQNPVKTDIRSARPAGTPFIYKDVLYRPAQDCSDTYGGGVAINKILSLTPNDFQEETASLIYPPRDSSYDKGIHTLSSLGQMTLIDGKRSVFSSGAFLNFFSRNFGRIFQRKKRPKREKVLVLGENSQSFLTVIRSLGRKNIEVHTAWCPSDCLSLYSRYIFKNHDLPSYSSKDDTWKEKLVDLMKNEKFDLIIPTNDQTIIPLQMNRKDLEPFGRIYLLDDSVFETVFNKTLANDLARSLNINLARELKVSSIDDMERILSTFSFPIVLKPEASFKENDLKNRSYVRIAQNKEELESYLVSLLSRGKVLAQEFFFGKGVGVEILAKNGSVLSAFSHERAHEPIWGGASSYRKSIPIDPELLKASQKIIKALAYSGVAMLEYKVNPENGRWIFMEINGRFWGSLPLSVSAGIDFPYYLYQMLTKGKDTFNVQYRNEIYCRNTWQDIGWMKKNIKADKKNVKLLTISAKVYFKELLNIFKLKEHNDTLTLDDPLPGLMEIWKIIKLFRDLFVARVKFTLLKLSLFRVIEKRRIAKKIKSFSWIIFICQGNICRSPFAQELAKKIHLSGKIFSAGYYPEKGRPCPAEAVQAGQTWDVDLKKHLSQIINEADLSESDLAFVFTREDYNTLLSKYPAQKNKLHLLGIFSTDDDYQIEDPYGKQKEGFMICYQKISESINNLINLSAKINENPRN
jgi:predicted ATP-grasp superfamily ATP-dependent carboligase/protein-tyrosine-phosphatase